ncbi:trypsin-like serine peptidase [Streptomyces antimicrobicus]|uniref:Serine protease n=1 Tax=Streptomyces antimicrobicus TaxID=2883108 RepID=A0ABS8B9F7_9ACTN|nr:serine protease [Streptomyces antimicrobicus]MCB5181257.1 serine protease [Streptomyces antimicrobicus]
MSATVRRRALRLSVLLGVCVALLLAGAAYLWQLRAFAGYLADGDATTGTYVQDPRLADRAAEQVLGGSGRTVPDPPPADAAPRADATAPAGGAPQAGPVTPYASPVPYTYPEPSGPAAADDDGTVERHAAVAPGPEPALGALFSPGDDGDPEHHCSASVVRSPGGSMIVTAAHCVYTWGFKTNLAFVPGYRNGAQPYGVWVPTRIDIDPRWSEHSDPDHDVAFVQLRRPGHPGARLEDLTGAAPVAFGAPLPAPGAHLWGYPNTAEEPLTCRGTARAAGPTQVRFDCTGFPNGTSGGPLLTAAGELIGVIGGRYGGGDDATSYSSRFDAATRALYARAAGGPPVTG